jgi:hypothetical protein
MVASIDTEALRRKYAAERDKRLRADGNDQYLRLTGELAHYLRDARELYVFQRTPSSVDARGNHPIDLAWFAEIATPGWQQRWLENFTANQAGGAAAEDLVQDGWTDIARRIRARGSG